MKNNITKYDAIIIGFGKGGKTLAGVLANSGKNVALVEKSTKMYGGTCINVGCIPTKFLVHHAEQNIFQHSNFHESSIAYQSAIQRKKELTRKLRDKNFQKLNVNPNITIINGTARFISAKEIAVEGSNGISHFEAEQFFINTGSSPFIPSITGIKDNPYVYISETLLELETLPETLAIIGGGYIGIEFASIYADFGTKVTIIQDGDTFLPREDTEIADMVYSHLISRGVEILKNTQVQSIEEGENQAILSIQTKEEKKQLQAQAVLIAAGRIPNTKDLNLEAAGVILDKRGGVITNEFRQTSVPHIFAMGDVVGGLQFTYISLDDFRIVCSKVLGDGSYHLKERKTVPYSVFLNPPFSRIGMSEKEAIDAGYHIKVAKLPASLIPKAQVLENPVGLLKAIIDKDTELILGVHLFCAESHEMINLIKIAMDARLPYTVLKNMIFTHPTMSEAFNDLFSI